MNRIKRLIFTAVTVLLAIGAFNLNTARAVIGYSSFDTFANNPASRWYCDNINILYADSNCEFKTNYGRTDYNSARLLISDSHPTGWVSVGRSIDVTPAPGVRYSTCSVQFFLQNWSSYHYSGGNAGVSGTIEVINPLTWTYISVKPFAFDRLDLDWHAVTTTFVPINVMFIRVVLTEANGDVRRLNIDNVVWQCNLA